jgi:hypothetical protein
MQNTRRHKRFKLDLVELDGNYFLIDIVEILDISFSGASLKVDRGLTIGKEYLMTLVEKGNRLEVKGIVVRSALSGSEKRADGENVPRYTASMKFKDGQMHKIADFINSLEEFKKKDKPAMVERRLHVRFHFTIPLETLLSHSAQFKVKKISLSGMLIQGEHALEINSMIPMGLSLNADNPVNFIGRVASCHMTKGKGQAPYEIGVAFSDMTDTGRMLLKTFVDELERTAGTPDGEKGGT